MPEDLLIRAGRGADSAWLAVWWAASLALLGLIALGWVGALRVSLDTIVDVKPCPQVVGVPACYIVLACYSMTALACVLQSRRLARVLFIAGWMPAFLLAAVGTSLEITVGQTCPRSGSGVPLCFVSLALVLSIAALFALRGLARHMRFVMMADRP